jgi:hypothetical protein
MHGKAYLFATDNEGVVVGSSNFTAAGLTREPSDWFGLMSNAVWTTTWEFPGTIGKFEPQFCSPKCR